MGAESFDVSTLLVAVDAGKSPDGVRIFHAKRTYYYSQACFSFFLVMVCFAMCGIMGLLLGTGALTSTSSTPGIEDTSSPDGWQWAVFAVLLLLCLLILACLGIGRGVAAIRGLRAWRTHVLVLAPGGLVARTGAAPHEFLVVSYAELDAIDLSIRHMPSRTFTDLVLTFRQSKPSAANLTQLKHEQMVWRVDARFGAADTIAQAILEDHARARAQLSLAK